MGKVFVTESYLDDIADAIRDKNGTENTYKPPQMAAAIEAIPDPSTLGTKTISANGTYDPASDNLDGYSGVTVNVPNSYAAGDEGKVVSNGVLVEQTARSSEITENGTYDTTLNDEVTVNVSGGGGQSVQSNRNFAVNWDFSNPVNNRGSSSYGSSGKVYTIDGWHVYGGKVTLVTGGLKLEQYASGTNGYFMQRFTNTVTTQIVGKQFTFSIIVDGELYSDTFTMPSANSGTNGVSAGGVNIRTWNYGTEIALTIDIFSDSGSHVVEAVKLEAGDTQTLASKVGNTWFLNDKVNANAEYIMARVNYVTNS